MREADLLMLRGGCFSFEAFGNECGSGASRSIAQRVVVKAASQALGTGLTIEVAQSRLRWASSVLLLSDRVWCVCPIHTRERIHLISLWFVWFVYIYSVWGESLSSSRHILRTTLGKVL